MIRSIKAKKRIPIKKIIDLFEFEIKNYKLKYSWSQLQINDDSNRKKLIDIISSIIGIQPHKIQNVILHCTSESINTHADCMSKMVYLIPLKYSKKTMFYDEDREIYFKPGYVYSFNDYIRHGLENEHGANVMILSVDT